jgi:hypothetical protein
MSLKSWLKKENGKKTLPCGEPYIMKTCHKDHKEIKLYEGTLKGLPGEIHSEEWGDLNIWLDSDRFLPPNLLLTSGILLPCEVKDVLFRIPDRGVPNDMETLEWVLLLAEECLKTGKTTHISCWGGHGRTGLMLSLLYGRAHPECLDPIKAIRTLGCSRWVESTSQEKFIFTFLGLTPPVYWENEWEKRKIPPKWDTPGFKFNTPFEKQNTSFIDVREEYGEWL